MKETLEARLGAHALAPDEAAATDAMTVATPAGSLRPFSLWVSLSRNPLRTLPMMIATLVASVGIASVVVLADSIVRTAVAPNDFLREALLVRAEGPTLDAVDRYLLLEARPPTTTRLGPPTFLRGRLLQFDTYFPVLLVPDGEGAALVQRYGDHLAGGRLPAPGTLEVAVPAGFARSRGLSIGDLVGGPGDFTPIPFRVVGLLGGQRWIAVGSASAVRSLAGPGPEALLLYEADPVRRTALEERLRQRFGGTADIRHWTAQKDGEDDTSYTDDLRLMLSFIVGMNASVLSIIGGLLALLYFRQRQAEFVLLSVLGWTKLDLARRTVAEITIVIGAGWVAGLVATWVLIAALERVVLANRAIVVDFSGAAPLAYTFPLALSTIVISGIVTAVALLRFDVLARLQAR